MSDPNHLRAIAICVFRNRGRILVLDIHDPSTGERFYRPTGGGIEFGEPSEAALRLSAIVFGAIDVLPFGWRALYAVGDVPMLLLAWFRRHMKETQRFEASRAERVERGDWRGWVEPLRRLLSHYPGRLGTLCLALWPLDFVLLTATTFMAKALQQLHGYSPGQVTLLYIAGGAVGIFGNTLAGSLSDRLGRRTVMVGLLAVAGACLYGFYNLSGWVIAPLWIAQVFAMMGVGVLFRTLGSELFQTSYRSTASAVRAIVATLGAVAGLTLEEVAAKRCSPPIPNSMAASGKPNQP